jgi:IS5 family transposase
MAQPCPGIREKKARNKSLSECQQRRNHHIAKARACACACVEHVFGAIEQMGGMLIRTNGQARANVKMTLSSKSGTPRVPIVCSLNALPRPALRHC